MANFQAVDIATGTPEKPKNNAIGLTEVIWTAAVTTALTLNDTILGPTIPAGTWLSSISVAPDKLDNGTAITFEAGFTGSLAAFITAGNTAAQAGGIAAMNVPGALGRTFATDTQVLVTITAAATTPLAGSIRIKLTYNANV